MTILQAKNICKSYTLPDSSSLEVLKDVCFDVEKKQIISIIGPSGVGKSTLLHIVGLMEMASSGEIFLEGKNVSNLSNDKKAIIRAQKVGFVFQMPMLIDDLTVEENIILANLAVSNRVNTENIEKILKDVGLLHKKSCYPSLLSTGEAQRVSIARSIVNNPSVILADEPISNLDKLNKIKILELFRFISMKTGISIVLVSHDEIVNSFSDKTFKLEEGRLIE